MEGGGGRESVEGEKREEAERDACIIVHANSTP